MMTHPYFELNQSFSYWSEIIIKNSSNLKLFHTHLKKETDIHSTLIKYDLCKHVVGRFRNCRLSYDGGSVLSTVFADKTQHVFEKKSERRENSSRVRLFQKSAQLVSFFRGLGAHIARNAFTSTIIDSNASKGKLQLKVHQIWPYVPL